MALHNVDRHSMDRSNPNPNTHDANYISSGVIVNTPPTGHKTASVNYVQPGTVPSIELYNGYKILVAKGSGTVFCSGASTTGTLTIPHGLGYTPLIEASVNNSTIGSFFPGPVNMPVPTWLDASIGGLVNGVVTFETYINAFVDATNVYLFLLNASMANKQVTVTYYLYQQRATQ